MIDFCRSPRAPGYFDELVDTLEQAIPFRSHVTNIDAPAVSGLCRQRHQFVRFRKGCGRVDDRASHPQCSFFHRLTDQSAHPAELFGRWGNIIVAKLVLANGCGPNERGDIHRRALAFERG